MERFDVLGADHVPVVRLIRLWILRRFAVL
jgi:hypothetical protein